MNADGAPFLTDNGNPIIDAKWPQIDDPVALERTLDLYPGVLECGLFLGLCDAVFLAGDDGVRRIGG
jgi:ribose 5-phosphate isomerase A